MEGEGGKISQHLDNIAKELEKMSRIIKEANEKIQKEIDKAEGSSELAVRSYDTSELTGGSAK